MNTVIEVSSLCQSYLSAKGKQPVLNSISFQVMRGEACGFIGQNGAGKSTTIRILTGLSRFDSGQVKIFDLPASDPKGRSRLGYCPENPYLMDTLTPKEWLGIAAHARGLKGQSAANEINKKLDAFGVLHVADKVIRSFSKGMTQRVALAFSMVGDPELLILDEPLSGLDPLGRRDVLNLLSEYHQSGGTLFFSSHVLSEVEQIAQRFILIDQGNLLTIDESKLMHSQIIELVWQSNNAGINGAIKHADGRWAKRMEINALPEAIKHISAIDGQILEVRNSASAFEEAFIKLLKDRRKS